MKLELTRTAETYFESPFPGEFTGASLKQGVAVLVHMALVDLSPVNSPGPH